MATKNQKKQSMVPELRFPEFEDRNEWKKTRFNQLLTSVADFRGRTPKKIGLEWGDGNIVSLSANNVKNGYIDLCAECNLGSNKLYEKWMEGVNLQQGDIVFTMEAPLGKAVLIPDSKKYILSQRVVGFKTNAKVLNDFLIQLIWSQPFQVKIYSLSTGSTAKGISQKALSKVEIEIPDIAEQQKIADCLGSLDDLIAAHSRKLDALQDHKKGLLQQLFPTEGQTTPKLRFPGFEGEWESLPIGKVVDNSFYGTSRSTSENAEIPVLRMGNMAGGTLDFSKLVYIDLEENEFDKIKLNSGDILLNRTNSKELVGKVSIFDESFPCITASYIVTYRLCKKIILPAFCNYMLNTPLYQARIRSLATPSISQWNINPTRFKKELIIVLPPKVSEQQKIADCLSALDALITAQTEQIAALKEHKKGLMQKLFPNPELKTA